MVKTTPMLWCTVFFTVMFSREIWFSVLFFMLYCIIGYSYIVEPEFSVERVARQAGCLLFVAFFSTLIIAIQNAFSKDKR